MPVWLRELWIQTRLAAPELWVRGQALSLSFLPCHVRTVINLPTAQYLLATIIILPCHQAES